MPGAIGGHDNFVHVRGNELSLHQFINGSPSSTIRTSISRSHQFRPGQGDRIGGRSGAAPAERDRIRRTGAIRSRQSGIRGAYQRRLPGEELQAGDKVAPAFDQRHSLVANASYRSSWRNFETGAIRRYGSGTPIEAEEGVFRYLPQHVTLDAMARLQLWRGSHQYLALEIALPNVTDNVYQIAKESEFTPTQYAPRRSVLANLRFHF